MLSSNTILKNRYRIIHELGHGGMGAIYQAMDENLSCVVAVKETFATTDDQRRAFKREAELLANLNHPTLPKVMDHFTHDDGQFLVMQFVPGHDLAELLQLREQPFSAARVLDWADQILDALTELHSSDPPIIHRDIKPSNLKVTPKGRILLLDFGLAKGVAGQMATAEVNTHSSSIYGYTAHYAPLEQIRRAGTDARSDLYSLGATMWTLLTGKVPPDALSRIAEKEDGNPDPLPAAGELNPKVSPSLSSSINRAMALNRSHRHASAAELRKDLANIAEAESNSQTFEPQVTRAESPLRPPMPPVSTVKSAESEPPRISNDQQVSTIRVATSSPELKVATPTATSFAGGVERQGGQRKRFALLASGAAVLILAIAVISWIVWGARKGGPQSNSSQASNTATNSNLSDSNRPTAPIGMVYVSGGTFMMGREVGDDAERPPHQVTVAPFFINAYEVTNEEYEKFVKATNHRPPSLWTDGTFPAANGRRPVTGVTWDDATEYARWAGGRLPTEEEWEFAARGTDGRLYPWGKDWRQGAANADGAAQAITDVGAYKSNSPFGTADMVGNAWEWTASSFKAYPGRGLPSTQPTGDLRVIRGGCYESNKDYATTTYRAGWPARGAPTYDQTGFRLAKDIGP
jgi:formylglycine-generating enzyme required for sulfatase activity